MKYTFDITRQDYADFNTYHFLKAHLKRTIFVGALAVVLIQYLFNRDNFDIVVASISTLFSVCLFVLIYYIMLSRTSRIPKDDGSILGSRYLEFGDNEITCNTSDSSSTIAWTKVKELGQGKKALYLYIDTNMAYIVPRRVFSSEQEMNAFIALVNSKIK